jgi:PncC family amidohydrolase
VTAVQEPAAAELAAAAHDRLLRRAETVAVAESVTGGLLGAAMTDRPGSSATFRGGVVAYATDVKASMLEVDADLLSGGAVSVGVALAMAAGARERLGATYGLATTGVAGPDPQDGAMPGTVHIGLAGPRGSAVRSLDLEGDRAQVRAATVRHALAMLLMELDGPADVDENGGETGKSLG